MRNAGSDRRGVHLEGPRSLAIPDAVETGASTKILYCCTRGFALSSSLTYRNELFPISSRGRTITLMKRLGRSAAAWAKTASGPVSYHAPPGPYEVERPWVSMRMPPSMRQRMPGPQCRCRKAQPPGGKPTLSPRRRRSPCGKVASCAASFSRETTPAAAGAAAVADVRSKRQQVAPVLPALSVTAPSPCQASPSPRVRSAIVTDPCTTKIMRGDGGSASVASSDKMSS